ncbi:glutamine synthetase family protein [Pusillimonas sp. NJUB218]|uniref:glutamine synthetase family protein n=1 Tax=Pusillimonas sp. NJUB218 TaxID=2023230 RepID=UPI000F4B9AE3|nr:glutamine synthetase family protein [Pusillimonas sp. NJUB218]ROT46623.1 glutamine synthetase [Pusillimonas sp. NJUB218]
MASFVERHGLWGDDQRACAAELIARIDAGEIETLRFAFPDQHGILRGKTLVAAEAKGALSEGVNLTTTLLLKDTSHKTVFPVFNSGGYQIPGMQGASDFTIVADPATFRILPWTNKAGWVLCDAYSTDGQPSPVSSRQIMTRAVKELDDLGYEFIAGLEVEFHVFRLDDPNMALTDSGQPGTPPTVSLLSHGAQYLTEMRYDRVDDVMELLRVQLQALGLPLRSLEVEFGPSQFELTFSPTVGLAPADLMILVRSAIKQICYRAGYHATFMCRPRIPNVMSSGWHLHQSLRSKATGQNAFVPEVEGADLSPLGMQYLAGLKAHACGAAALASPTINGYRRYRPFSLAPDRAVWARDNRAAMLRVLGGVGQSATRIENRVGEPTANPYLYMASQLYAGLDGIARQLDPGPSADVPYEAQAELLPRSLGEALQCLRNDACLVEKLGPGFVDYFCHIKEAEIARFNLDVSEWEHREYFDLF